MTTDNYTSPYGFGPVTDAIIDSIAENHEMTPGRMADAFDQLSPAQRSRLDDAIEDWWEQHMSYAHEKLDDAISNIVYLTNDD